MVNTGTLCFKQLCGARLYFFFQHETILIYLLLTYPFFKEIFVFIYRYLIAIKPGSHLISSQYGIGLVLQVK
jgi:hypothetical protein